MGTDSENGTYRPWTRAELLASIEASGGTIRSLNARLDELCRRPYHPSEVDDDQGEDSEEKSSTG